MFRDLGDLWTRTETALRADGVTHPSQVYSDSFDFYFPSVHSRRVFDYRPRTAGGWAQIDLYGYYQVHPQVRLTTLSDFLEDLQRTGVTHLALSPTAGAMLPALAPPLTGGSVPAGLRDVGDVGGMRVLGVEGAHVR
jgi:hypothetical protein